MRTLLSGARSLHSSAHLHQLPGPGRAARTLSRAQTWELGCFKACFSAASVLTASFMSLKSTNQQQAQRPHTARCSGGFRVIQETESQLAEWGPGALRKENSQKKKNRKKPRPKKKKKNPEKSLVTMHAWLLQVGWFLHTPFPSSEMYRTLPVREELLRAVLKADLIGFHTYDYARHFVSACTRILGLEVQRTLLQFE